MIYWEHVNRNAGGHSWRRYFIFAKHSYSSRKRTLQETRLIKISKVEIIQHDLVRTISPRVALASSFRASFQSKSVSKRKTRLRRKGARHHEEERKPLAVVPQTAPYRNQISTLNRTAKLFGVFINGELNAVDIRLIYLILWDIPITYIKVKIL